MTYDDPNEKALDYLAHIRAEQAARRSGERLIEAFPVYGVSLSPAEIEEPSSASVIQITDGRRRLSRSNVIPAPKKPPVK
jgi:hypothetical protein